MAASVRTSPLVFGSLKFIIRLQQRNALSKVLFSSRQNETPTDGKHVLPPPQVSPRIVKISQAMQMYLERAKAHDEMMSTEISSYEIGKRHLANMMGEDADLFQQEDIDKAIEYLLPSGIFEKKARPLFKHPEEVFTKKKAAQFDVEGRPFHYLFYTWKPNYYQLLHEIVGQVELLNKFEEQLKTKNQKPEKALNVEDSEWIDKAALEKILLESVSDVEFQRFLVSIELLVSHPCSYKAGEFIKKYRKPKLVKSLIIETTPLSYDENGRGYSKASARRKTANAEVIVKGPGSGQMTINGKDIGYFQRMQCREQLMFPLQLTDKLGELDVEATVSGGGDACQAGAIRLAMSLALCSFVTKEDIEKMRLAGLLNFDPRTRERKKPGQEGARRKYTWLKR